TDEAVTEAPAKVVQAAIASKPTVAPKAEAKKAPFVSPTAKKSTGQSTDVEKAFDDLFNS
ncbi:MAG: hypothetical protein ACKPKO_50280, partial [Candidatus Fonsibacter sp.]